MKNPSASAATSATIAPTPQLASKSPAWKISPASGKYFINSVAVSADGGTVVGGTFYHVYGATESRSKPTRTPPAHQKTASPDDGTFGTYCYNRAGQLRWHDEFAGWQGVYWVAVSADGTRAASGGLMTQSPQAGFVRAYDASNGKQLLKQATKERVNQVALSKDGSWLVSAAETLILFQYNTASGQYVQTYVFTPPTPPPGDWNGIVSTAISADGLTVVAADYNGNINVFANTGGTLVSKAHWKVPGGQKSDFCHMVDLTPDGTAFAAGGASGNFYLFNVAQFITSGQPTYGYNTGLNEAVYGVAVASTGAMFAGVVNKGVAGAAYLISDGTAITTQFTLQRNPNSASLNVAHGLFAIADGHPDGTPGHFYLYSNINTSPQPMPILRWVFQTGNMSWPVVISANGSAVVGGSDDSYIYYFTP